MLLVDLRSIQRWKADDVVEEAAAYSMWYRRFCFKVSAFERRVVVDGERSGQINSNTAVCQITYDDDTRVPPKPPVKNP